MTTELGSKRTIQRLLFALICLFVALITLDVGLSWRYITRLIHPGCSPPRPIPDLHRPEEHHLVTEDGLKLRYWYYPTANGAAILSIGGLGGSLGDKTPPVEPLIQNGFGVLQIDSRSCAQPSAIVSLGANEIKDAVVGLEFLLSRPEVNPEKIAIYGFSMGAVTAIRTAAHHPRIAALVAEGGYANLGQHIARPEISQNVIIRVFRYTLSGMYWLRTGINPWSISPVDDISSISPRPLFLIYGENEIEDGDGWAQYQAAQQPKVLWIVPDGDHGHNHLIDPDRYEFRVVEFFQKTIGNQTIP